MVDDSGGPLFVVVLGWPVVLDIAEDIDTVEEALEDRSLGLIAAEFEQRLVVVQLDTVQDFDPRKDTAIVLGMYLTAI